MIASCLHCAKSFKIKPSMAKRGRGRFCKRSCFHEWMKTHPQPHFMVATPESTEADRIRAQGLINMRVRRGAMKRPKLCQGCGRRRRLDGHHDNYAEPDVVRWLCRSCHMKEHRNLYIAIANGGAH